MIRRAVRVVAAVLALVCGVVVVRTLMVRPETAPSPRATLAPEFDVQQAAQRLAGLIRIPTVATPDGVMAHLDGFHASLAAAYPVFHATARREVLAGGTLLFTWQGSDATLPPIILMAHQDVVPAVAPEQWTQPPFSGVVTDTAVWGRGAVDNKGSLVAILEAVEALAVAGHQPARTVHLVFGHDEETRGAGAAQAASLLAARGIAPLFVLDEGSLVVADHPVTGGAVALVGLSEKGYATVRLTARAPGGHSSAPPRETAVGLLAGAIEAVLARPFPRRLDGAARAMLEALAPHARWPTRMAIANAWLLGPVLVGQMGATPQGAAMLQTTIAPTMLSGSERENVLATEASAMLNLRLVPGDTVEGVLRHLRRSLGDLPVTLELVGEHRDPSIVSPVDSAGYRAIATAARTVFDAPVAPAPVIAATDSRSFAALTAHIYRFQPLQLSLADTTMIHGIDEHLRIDALEKMIRFYAALLVEAAGDATATGASPSPATMQ